jgi:hypothetical protein
MDAPFELVASLRLIGVGSDGRERAFVVGVGLPARQPTSDWACPTLAHDEERLLRLIHGEDSLQALCLGLSYIRMKLEDHLEKGGRLLLPEGREEISRHDLAAWFSRIGRDVAG